MTALTLDGLRGSMEGVYASMLATCDAEGTPNVSMISQVHYVDPEHVALSYQFFNKTRANVMQTRMAAVQITDPATFSHHRLDLDYVETQTSGPIFETMKAKLAGIASHHGMDGVFRLLGADIFRVLRIDAVPGPTLPPAEPRRLLASTRQACAELAAAQDLETLLDGSLRWLEEHYGIRTSMILMLDGEEERLFTVASRGYARSGIGSEVAFGEGVIGVAARERTAIRIGHMTREYRYGTAITETARRAGLVSGDAQTIRFPGLSTPRSQMALPISGAEGLLGVLFVEDEEPMRFDHEDEDALAIFADHLAARIALFRREEAEEAESAEPESAPEPGGQTLRFHPHDQSVFLDNDYIIKGSPGRSSGGWSARTGRPGGPSSPRANCGSIPDCDCRPMPRTSTPG
ncbi:GAF domain-containing protein [Seohaeicola zhoushanensis]